MLALKLYLLGLSQAALGAGPVWTDTFCPNDVKAAATRKLPETFFSPYTGQRSKRVLETGQWALAMAFGGIHFHLQ